jgi:hypothetical protein
VLRFEFLCRSISSYIAKFGQTVDFVIWRLWKRCTSHKPFHLLCHGFQRSGVYGAQGAQKTAHSIPGLFSYYKNTCVETVKKPVWCRLHALLGKGGELIMMDLLTHCGIFSLVEGGSSNYFQLSGLPLSDLKLESGPAVASKDASKSEIRKPNTISFVRNRMMYARAAVNAKGGVRFGMRHIREQKKRSVVENS